MNWQKNNREIVLFQVYCEFSCSLRSYPGFLINKVFRRSRRRAWSCSKLLQMPGNEAAAEKSVGPKGELFDLKQNTAWYLRC